MGKTLGDVVDEVLTQPKKWFALLLLLTSFAGLTLLVIWAFTDIFAVQTSELVLGSTDSHITFQAEEGRNGIRIDVVVVPPQGWQKAGIPVQAGDHLSFTAGGKVCIDMHEIWEKVQLRQKYEDEYAQKLKIRRDDDTETRVPEDYFTDAEKKSLILHRPWVDPDGFHLADFQPSFRSRHSRYLLPDKPAGGLVGAISNSDSEPDRSEAFFIGRQNDYLATKQGMLWLTVNDVQYSDPNNKNLFYNDNIGSFWVRIVVKHDKKL